MDDKISRYNVTLTVKTPTFVGSGKVYSKLDYVYKNRCVDIYDTEKLFNLICEEKKIECFENYIEKNNKKSNLVGFLKKSGLEMQAEECKAYTIDTPIFVGGEIKCFMRDADGNPYIPGSSIKGALRTAIISALLNNDAFREKRNAFKRGENITNEGIEEYFSRKIMNGISVSDTSSVNNKDLIICKKQDVAVNGDCQALNVFRECLRPETKLGFVLKLDNSLIKLGINVDVEFLKEVIKWFNKYYTDTYIERFHFNGSDKPELKCGNIILGGGTGYFSKNINYPLYGYQEGLRKVSNDFVEQRERRENEQNIDYTLRRQHRRDEELGISPHMLKFTQYDGKMLHMGICNLKFEELKNEN